MRFLLLSFLAISAFNLSTLQASEVLVEEKEQSETKEIVDEA